LSHRLLHARQLSVITDAHMGSTFSPGRSPGDRWLSRFVVCLIVAA